MKVIDIFGNKTTIQTFDDAKMGRQLQRIFAYDEAKCKTLNEQGAGVFWTINPQEDPNHRGIATTTSLTVLGMDCDITKEADKKRSITRLPEADVQELKTDLFNMLIALPVPSSGIIETRNGLQPYWVFINPIKLAPNQRQEANIRYQDLVRGFTRITGIKSEGDNIQRVLRMPGYYHKKSDEAFLVKDIFEKGVSCDFETFKKAYPPIAKETPTQGKNITSISNFTKPEDIPVQDALIKLSGTAFVDNEEYSFRHNNNGTIQILVNGKTTSQWIDPTNNTIGGAGEGQGNPTIIQWVAYYYRRHGDNNTLAHAKAYQALYPLLLPHIPESQWRKTKSNAKPELIIPTLDISHVAQMMVNPDYAKGVPTQFTEFDKITRGLRRQFTYGIVAASGQGKSLFAVNTLYNVAMQGYPVLYIDLENGEIMGERRFLQIHKGWTTSYMESLVGQDSDVIEKELRDCESKIKFYRIYDLGDLQSERKHNRVMRIIEKYVNQKSIRVAVIDNINCFIPDGRLGDNEYKNEIYVAFDRLAVDLNISIIEIHHATDKLQKDMGYSKQDVENKKPKKFILPYLSKALGTSTFIEKIKVGMTLAIDEESSNLVFSVQKNRDGENGFFYLAFDKETLRISNPKNNGFLYPEPVLQIESASVIDADDIHEDNDIIPLETSTTPEFIKKKDTNEKIIANPINQKGTSPRFFFGNQAIKELRRKNILEKRDMTCPKLIKIRKDPEQFLFQVDYNRVQDKIVKCNSHLFYSTDNSNGILCFSCYPIANIRSVATWYQTTKCKSSDEWYWLTHAERAYWESKGVGVRTSEF